MNDEISIDGKRIKYSIRDLTELDVLTYNEKIKDFNDPLIDNGFHKNVKPEIVNEKKSTETIPFFLSIELGENLMSFKTYIENNNLHLYLFIFDKEYLKFKNNPMGKIQDSHKEVLQDETKFWKHFTVLKKVHDIINKNQKANHI